MRNDTNIVHKLYMLVSHKNSKRLQMFILVMIIILSFIPQVDAYWRRKPLGYSGPSLRVGTSIGWQDYSNVLFMLPTNKNHLHSFMFVKPNTQSFPIENPLYPDFPRLVVTSNCQPIYREITYDSLSRRIGETAPIPRFSSAFDCCLAYIAPGGGIRLSERFLVP